MYDDVQERIPENAPIPRGKEVEIPLYVDSGHAGCKKPRKGQEPGSFSLLTVHLSCGSQNDRQQLKHLSLELSLSLRNTELRQSVSSDTSFK